jgi:Protein of unknown function (DUF2802)
MPNMPAFSPDLLYALGAAACAALAAAGLLASWRIRSRGTLSAVDALSRQLGALRAENGAQSATLVALAARFDELQRQLATDARYATTPTGGASASAYELAIRLARGGASVEELVSGCMMSRHEAELTLRLHSPHNRPGVARLAAVRQA